MKIKIDWIVIFTGLMVVVGFLQYQVYCTQQKIMENEQRPWIKPIVSIAGPITWTADHDAQIRINIKKENIGHLPAVNVQTIFEVHAKVKETLFDITTDLDRLCKLARRNADIGFSTITGETIFPNDFSEGMASGNASHEEISKAWPSSHRVLFSVIGCMDYTYPNNTDFHGQTRFAYDLTKIDKNKNDLHETGFDPSDGDVSSDYIAFKKDIFNDYHLK